MKNVRLIMGHRGVGKTSLLGRLETYFPEHVFLDLDEEVSKFCEKTIELLFLEEKEMGFRALEQKTLHRIIEKYEHSEVPVWVALGAGVLLDKMNPEERALCTLIWVARDTDDQGRIFLDRPRLDEHETPLVEYLQRYNLREQAFNQHYDLKYDMMEGLEAAKNFSCDQLFKIEKKFFQGEFHTGKFGFTLQKEDFLSPQRWRHIQREMLKRNFEFLELRDDLLSQDQIRECFEVIPEDQILLSLRDPEVALKSISILLGRSKKVFGVDIECQLMELLVSNLKGLSHSSDNVIISSHNEKLPWTGFENREKDFHFKWSPLVEDFPTLENQLKLLETRSVSYLPRSSNGRWSWFRLRFANKNRINFLNHGHPSSLDQPTLFDVLANSPSLTKFAAVLGKPIGHSFSPAMHFDFFYQRQMPFYRIEISEAEWTKAYPILKSFGLLAAAVTSPLKIRAFTESKAHDQAKVFKSVNTLMEIDGKDHGWNTDGLGFSAVTKFSDDENIMIWGGGGTKEMMKFYLPKAEFISARNPELQPEHFKREWSLIWASPRTSETHFPPAELKIRNIKDLNYGENSMGRELALFRKIPYVSGLEMLVQQAIEQQKIWKDLE